ncbi:MULTISPECIES: transcription antitermination factor NusB [unclassified Leptolyngbya]|uniref:transcription antitermination factor NusB n=1 Tax=unclassified Leptolyngbya TaxID=2650499 RepID=UPI0016851FFA|nr:MULTISPECIES: transcription antitermination factor NusB [unclassified Leptolyngbya]MBD1911814.1 transcription antitermination protein NusB [Leptolyngbya sp. FACHB-8]MBD2153296.1 transcription antitermination protein NusB [Leptolyngbya sp. FACHB-16]
MQARRIARELALLSLSQLPTNPDKLQAQELPHILLAAIRTLTSEVQDALETAGGELERASDRLLSSEINAADLQSAREMVKEAVEQAKNSVNRLGIAVDLPEFIQLANQQEVRDYALDLLTTVRQERETIDTILANDMVNWQMHRLPRIDQDILRISVAEQKFMGVPDRVAINEAIELAKRYSGEEGHRFINGVLRRVSDSSSSRPSVT